MAGQFQFFEACYSSATTPAEQAMDGPIRLHEEKKDLEEWTLGKLKANKQSQKKNALSYL